MEFVMGMSGRGFQWVDPVKDLSYAQSIAIPDLQHINSVVDAPEDAEFQKSELAAAKKVVEELAERLKSEGIFPRVERSEKTPVDLILRGAVTDFSIFVAPVGLRRGFLQVEAFLVEVKTRRIVGRIQATGQPLAGGLLALLERTPEGEVITQLRDFLRDKVKKLK
jgi:hypothetical protein